MSVLKSLKSLGSRAKGFNSDFKTNMDHQSRGSRDEVVPFWMERIKHQGRAPFHPNPEYKVFRNVKVRWRLLIKQEIHSILIGIRCYWRWSAWWCGCYQVGFGFWVSQSVEWVIYSCFLSRAISAQNRCGGGSCRSSTWVSSCQE